MPQHDAGDGIGEFARDEDTPLGKCANPVKTHLDDITYDKWLRLCAERNRVPGKVLRDVIWLMVHGRTPAEMSAQDIRELLALRGLNADLTRIGGR